MSAARVAVVTGGGGGIGREHALSLAARGYAVVVNDVGGRVDGDGTDAGPAERVVREIEARGGSAVVSVHDISDWDQAGALIAYAVECFGALDVLINNAGILRDAVLYKLTSADWHRVIDVHLGGTAATMHHAAGHWRERAKRSESGPWRVINTTSGSGLFGNVGQANYGAAKAGIAALTIIAAKELAQYGVTVNAISPLARSRMLDSVLDEVDLDLSPAHVAKVATWLASEDAAGVTGQVFSIIGNRVVLNEGWTSGPMVDMSAGWAAEDLERAMPEMLARTTPRGADPASAMLSAL